MAEKKQAQRIRPAQRQRRQPGTTEPMDPRPRDDGRAYRGSGKLAGKVVLITGGDSGIGRSVAVASAKEGADVAIAYLNEHGDAEATAALVRGTGARCLTVAGDIGDERFVGALVKKTLRAFGRLDVVISNAAEQHPQDSILAITTRQLERTFKTNVHATFHLAKAALPHLKAGSAIIITTSVTAYRGSPHLLDYAATKGALVAFMRSLALSLVDHGIRVNAVAPGPVWTPLIPSTFPADEVATFGSTVPMGRAADPDEMAAAYIFLACDDASFVTGQTIHLNGGEIING